ncbi:MAG: cytochrome c oxidase subunit 3 [Planctomycetota bacterium]|jgi:cytochrome c oxidase subunit 3
MIQHGSVSPFDDHRERFAAGRFGMGLFLASVAMLFAASIIGFVVLRVTSEQWPDDLPRLPWTSWLSTAVLLASSWTLSRGVRAVRTGDAASLGPALRMTFALGVIFLGLQGLSWWGWLADLAGRLGASQADRFALSGFYVLTGVHALHVIGGLVPMAIVIRGAARGRYDADRYAGVQYCAMYWHFLDAIWIVLFATLLAGL